MRDIFRERNGQDWSVKIFGNNILDPVGALDDTIPTSKSIGHWLCSNKGELPEVYCDHNYDLNDEEMVDIMEFRLVYEGSLPASGNSSRHPKEKHAIRKVFHTQLAELWEHNKLLQLLKTRASNKPNEYGSTYLQVIARQFERCGYQFVPLVNKEYGLVCSLDVLFLRRENPGEVVTQGGDIDNRIKTLFDALRMPDSCNEVFGSPGPDEAPFFCLLQSDSLITEVNVTTDRLLTPLKQGQHRNEVVLIIQVKVKAAESLFYGNLHFKA